MSLTSRDLHDRALLLCVNKSLCVPSSFAMEVVWTGTVGDDRGPKLTPLFKKCE